MTKLEVMNVYKTHMSDIKRNFHCKCRLTSSSIISPPSHNLSSNSSSILCTIYRRITSTIEKFHLKRQPLGQQTNLTGVDFDRLSLCTIVEEWCILPQQYNSFLRNYRPRSIRPLVAFPPIVSVMHNTV